MSEAESLCSHCARCQRTCCQFTEIYVSLGDLARIAAHTGSRDFFEYAAPVDPDYQTQDDPVWQTHVFREDGTRRVLKHHPNGDCHFLTPTGCNLPQKVRPLVCRLYPFQYDERGLLDVAGQYCPMNFLAPGQDLVVVLNMKFEDAVHWHEQLYAEIREEKRHACSSV
jgi:Fe-S-cluster containining protein